MREVDIGGAIASGFKLIAREPVAFLAWGVVYAVVGLAPQVLITGSTFSALSAIDPSKTQDPAAIQALVGPMQSLQWLSLITSMVSWVLLYGAIFRAALFPEDRQYLYLRLGPRELWMGLTLLVQMALYGLGFFAMFLPLMIIVGVGAAAGGGGGAGVVAALLIGVPAVIAVMLWGASRLSVALPMSFAQSAFILPEAWRQTRGHAGRIFLVFLALFAILLLGEMLLLGVGFGLVTAFVPLPELGQAFQNPAKLFSKINPAVWVAVTFVWALLGAASAALFSAALAHVYRDLSPEDPAEVFA